MSETITVKLQPLTAEAFRPYGHIVDSTHPAYPDVEEGRPAVVWVHLQHQPNAKRVGQLAIHFSYPPDGHRARAARPRGGPRAGHSHTPDHDCTRPMTEPLPGSGPQREGLRQDAVCHWS